MILLGKLHEIGRDIFAWRLPGETHINFAVVNRELGSR